MFLCSKAEYWQNGGGNWILTPVFGNCEIMQATSSVRIDPEHQAKIHSSWVLERQKPVNHPVGLKRSASGKMYHQSVIGLWSGFCAHSYWLVTENQSTWRKPENQCPFHSYFFFFNSTVWENTYIPRASFKEKIESWVRVEECMEERVCDSGTQGCEPECTDCHRISNFIPYSTTGGFSWISPIMCFYF